MPATIPGNTPAPAPQKPAQSAIAPWALDRATTIVAAAQGRPYLVAIRDIAELLMFTRAEGVREGWRQSSNATWTPKEPA